MKNVNSLWVGLVAVALIAASCAREPVAEIPKDNNDGSLVVSIGAAAKSRAIVDGLISDPIIRTYENNITEAIVYVVNANDNTLEAKEFVDETRKAIFTDLNTNTPKRIVAVANGTDAGIDAALNAIEVGDNFSTEIRAITVNFNTQIASDFTDLTTGFLMSGEYDGNSATPEVDPYTLAATGGNIVLPVERVVAKIELGEITFGDGVTIADMLYFHVNNAGIQRAISDSYIYPGPISGIPTSPVPIYYGAWGTASGGGSISNNSDADITDALANSGSMDITGLVTDLIDASGILERVVDVLSPLGAGLDLVLGPLGLGGIEELLENDIDIDQIQGILENPVTRPLVSPLLNVTLGSLSFVTDNLVYDTSAFWYVLPNNGTNMVNSTLLTLKGDYREDIFYYPVAINGVAMTDDDPTDDVKYADGTFIQRNTRYIVNIEFNSLIGVDDPDDPTRLPTLIVTVVPAEWAGPIIQDAVW